MIKFAQHIGANQRSLGINYRELGEKHCILTNFDKKNKYKVVDRVLNIEYV